MSCRSVCFAYLRISYRGVMQLVQLQQFQFDSFVFLRTDVPVSLILILNQVLDLEIDR